ncbi:MAG TPA: HEAT repeat domain-containing protein [Vicinamibacterales bacterium]|jgi:HEAT repeat protein
MRSLLFAVAAILVASASPAQIPFDQALAELTSPDEGTRLHAAQLLREAAFEEAALPLVPLIADRRDAVQFEAIAAELNIFLADKLTPGKRKPGALAEPVFSTGPLALGPRPVPIAVVNALLAAARDDNPRVALEALYAFGTLAVGPGGSERNTVLAASGPRLAAFLGSTDPATRYAAVRVMGRVFARRASDPPIEPTVGDALITALNDADRLIKPAAMTALGSMRYDRAVQALTDLSQYYGKGPLAEASLDGLAHIANPASVTVFSTLLGAKGDALKGIAVEGLARLGDPAKLPDIQAALAGKYADATMLTGAFARGMLSNASLDPIAEALAKPKLRDQARGYLVELAPGRLALFARYLQDPDAKMRADVADVLYLADDPVALSLLQPLLNDKDSDVVKAAERAVARLRQH